MGLGEVLGLGVAPRVLKFGALIETHYGPQDQPPSLP